jgi:hypothetical protein
MWGDEWSTPRCRVWRGAPKSLSSFARLDVTTLLQIALARGRAKSLSFMLQVELPGYDTLQQLPRFR